MVVSARHRWPEPSGFTINRPNGIDIFTFLHFFRPVRLKINGQTIITKPNACILYNIYTPQWFCSDEPLLHDWIHLNSEAVPLLKNFSVPVNKVFYPADTSFITAAICETELEILSQKPYSSELADAAATMLLIRLGRACSESSDTVFVNTELRTKLYNLRINMFSSIGESWTVERMAKAVHLSPSRFFAVYKALFSVSPIDDLIHARIDAAKSALTGTDISVTELAYRLGYANVTHFSRQFRRQTGISPSAYAKRR